MKNLLFFLLPVMFFISCKKDNTSAGSTPVDKIMLDNAVVISKGSLVFSAADNGAGMAKIYLQEDGRYVLGLEDMDYKTVFDLGVYLSATPVYSSASLKLFSAKNFDNNIYYKLPAGINGGAYKYVIMQKPAAASPVATAALN